MFERTFILGCFLLTGLGASAGAAPTRFQSAQPGASEADAIAVAVVEAAGTFVPALRERTELSLRRDFFAPRAPNDAILQSMIAAKLTDGRVIAGRHVEKRSRPYGDVYFATLTLDPPANWLDDLTRRATAMARHDRRAGLYSTAGAVGLLTMISVGYLAANAITKGYYRTRLRVLAMTAVVAGAAVLSAAYHGLPVTTTHASQRTIEPAWPN